MYISIFELEENEMFFRIFDDDPDVFKPYYKEVQTCANFLCDYYNFTIKNATSEYILDYLELSDDQKKEIEKILFVDESKEKIFREIFEFVLSEYYPDLKHYTMPQRMAAYETIKKQNDIVFCQKYYIGAYLDAASDDSINIYIDTNNISEKNMLKVLSTLDGNDADFVYESDMYLDSMWDFICFCINKVITNNIPIKRCANCGKFFSPTSRIDEIYCNYEYKNGKTCKEIGYANKVNNSTILKEYRKVYKTKNAWKNRNMHKIPEAEIMFIDWHEQAKDMLEQARQGIISEDQFLKWLEENK